MFQSIYYKYDLFNRNRIVSFTLSVSVTFIVNVPNNKANQIFTYRMRCWIQISTVYTIENLRIESELQYGVFGIDFHFEAR